MLKGHYINSVGFSPGGTRVVSGSNDGTVHIWDATTDDKKHVPEGHSTFVQSVTFSHDGTRVVSGLWDK